MQMYGWKSFHCLVMLKKCEIQIEKFKVLCVGVRNRALYGNFLELHIYIYIS